jgi:hypothetical protein
VEKFRVDAHTILHTCNGVKWSTSGIEACYEDFTEFAKKKKKISMVTY